MPDISTATVQDYISGDKVVVVTAAGTLKVIPYNLLENYINDGATRLQELDESLAEKESQGNVKLSELTAALQAIQTESVERAARYTAINYTGDFVASTDYEANDVWKNTATGSLWIVPADYTSGATAQADIDAKSVRPHQDRDRVQQVNSIENLKLVVPEYEGQNFNLGVGGLHGSFEWLVGDYSWEVENDPKQGVYVELDNLDASHSVLKRHLDGYVTPAMFGGDIHAASVFIKKHDKNLELRASGETSNKTLYPTGYNITGTMYVTEVDQAIRPIEGDSLIDSYVRIDGAIIDSEGQGVGTNGECEFDILNSIISSSSFGVLINESADMDGSIIANSRIKSEFSDAVEYNTVDGGVKNIVNTGLIVEGGVSGSGSSSGFSLGYAKTKTVALSGNVSNGSRNEALHIEDLSERFTASAQSYADCGGDGVRILADSGTDIPSYAFSAIVAEKTKTDGSNWDKTNIGWHQVWDGNGTIPGIPVSAATMIGFNTGFKFGDAGGQVVGPLSSFGCTYGIEQSNKSAVYGLVRVEEADYVVKSGSGNIYPNVSMGKNVGDIVNRSSLNSGRVGATFRGLSGSIYATFTGGQAYTYVPILPAKSVDRASGKLVCICDMEGNGGFVYSLDFKWNGSTLTIIDSNNRGFGTKGTSSPRVDSDNLEIRIFNASGGTNSGTVRWYFDGHITLGGES